MKIALLFPGYGNQRVGMCKDIYDNFREIQESFDEASHCLGINFVKLCFASSDSELSSMRHAYTSLFLISTSIARLVLQHIPSCDLVAGYNNGEISALSIAGALNGPDGLYILNKYTSLCEPFLSVNDYTALTVYGAITDDVEDACFRSSHDSSIVSIALYISPTSHIIAGSTHAVLAARTLLEGHKDTHCTPLSPAVGLHSPLMASVATQLKMYLEKIDFRDTKTAFLSCVNGALITAGTTYKQYILDHITQPLHWTFASEIISLYDCIIQIGPGTELTDSLKTYYPHKKIYSINTAADFNQLENLK